MIVRKSIFENMTSEETQKVKEENNTKTLIQVTSESIDDWKTVKKELKTDSYSFFHHLLNIKDDQDRIDSYLLIDVYCLYTREA